MAKGTASADRRRPGAGPPGRREPRVVLDFPTDDYNATQGMVAAGAGITLLPRLALAVPRDDLAVRPLTGDDPRRLVAAATRRDDQGPATLEMLAEVRRVSGSPGPWHRRSWGPWGSELPHMDRA